MLIIPAIDLRNGKCVRLARGRKEAMTVYAGDPIEIARNFERAGARLLHVVDLDRAFSRADSPNRLVLDEIIDAIGIPVQLGGGLRSVDDVRNVVDRGVARVVIGTLAVESPETLKELVRLFGGGRIVVGIDAREGRVMTRGWETDGNTAAVELARRVAKAGIERIVCTDIARDGMLGGVNVEQTCLIARESGLKVTASGGVSSIDDLKRFQEASSCGVDSVIIGKALYEKRFTLTEALQVISVSSTI